MQFVSFCPKKRKKGAHIAFGPYLCTGIMISLLYGEKLIQAYYHCLVIMQFEEHIWRFINI